MNYDLDISDSPALEVNRCVKGATTGEKFSTHNEFIESTQHRSRIIQVKHLKDRQRNDLERLLSVFDQSNRREDGHVLEVREEELPEQYRPLFRRLIQAGATPQLRRQMDLEDTYVADYLDAIRSLAESNKALEEKDKMIEALRKQLEEMKKRKRINHLRSVCYLFLISNTLSPNANLTTSAFTSFSSSICSIILGIFSSPSIFFSYI